MLLALLSNRWSVSNGCSCMYGNVAYCPQCGSFSFCGCVTANESPSYIRIACSPFYFPAVSAPMPTASNFPSTFRSSRHREAVTMATDVASASQPAYLGAGPQAFITVLYSRGTFPANCLSPLRQQRGEKNINFKSGIRPRNS